MRRRGVRRLRGTNRETEEMNKVVGIEKTRKKKGMKDDLGMRKVKRKMKSESKGSRERKKKRGKGKIKHEKR